MNRTLSAVHEAITYGVGTDEYGPPCCSGRGGRDQTPDHPDSPSHRADCPWMRLRASVEVATRWTYDALTLVAPEGEVVPPDFPLDQAAELVHDALKVAVEDNRLHAEASAVARLTLFDIGADVRDWRLRNFGPQSILRHALQLCEEAGEVARAVGKADEGIRPETRGNLADELADVILSTAALAMSEGIDLEDAVRRRLVRLATLDARGSYGTDGKVDPRSLRVEDDDGA